MRVVTIAAAKGGSTKTTVTLSLATRATQETILVAMFDLNSDQADLSKWWHLRGGPLSPRLVEVEKIEREVALLRKEGYEWLFIDTPPGNLDLIEAAVAISDAVVIPVRPALFDLDGVTPVAEMCRERRKPFKILLSASDSKMPRTVESARMALRNDGPIFETKLRYLQAYIVALNTGKSAAEIDKACQAEISELWAEVKQLASTPSAALRAVFAGNIRVKV